MGLDAEKVEQLCTFLGHLTCGNRVHRKTLEEGCGRLSWTAFLFPQVKAWLSSFFNNLNRPGERWLKLTAWQAGIAQQSPTIRIVGLSREVWVLLRHMDEHGRVTSAVDGVDVPAGWRIWKIGKTPMGDARRWRGWWPRSDCSVGFVEDQPARIRVTKGTCRNEGSHHCHHVVRAQNSSGLPKNGAQCSGIQKTACVAQPGNHYRAAGQRMLRLHAPLHSYFSHALVDAASGDRGPGVHRWMVFAYCSRQGCEGEPALVLLEPGTPRS